MTSYLRRGALAGIAASTAAAMFLLLVGESSIAAATALETAAGAPGSRFTRTQQVAGGVLGVLVLGSATGAIFGVVFAAVRHRLDGDDWRRSLALATVGFATVFLVPFLKYPANPPAVGDPGTVGRRTALYLVVLAWSVVSAWGAWQVRHRLADRAVPAHFRDPAALAAGVALMTVAMVVLPGSPDEVTAPASLVWSFRLASLGGAALFWSVLGVAFGWLSLGEAGTLRPRLPARSR